MLLVADVIQVDLEEERRLREEEKRNRETVERLLEEAKTLKDALYAKLKELEAKVCNSTCTCSPTKSALAVPLRDRVPGKAGLPRNPPLQPQDSPHAGSQDDHHDHHHHQQPGQDHSLGHPRLRRRFFLYSVHRFHQFRCGLIHYHERRRLGARFHVVPHSLAAQDGVSAAPVEFREEPQAPLVAA